MFKSYVLNNLCATFSFSLLQSNDSIIPKSIWVKYSNTTTLQNFLIMKTIPVILKLSLLVVLINLLTSCHYYKATTQNTTSITKKASVTDSLAKAKRYFILRNGTASFNMDSLTLGEDQKSVTFILNSVNKDHLKYIQSGAKNHTYDKSQSAL